MVFDFFKKRAEEGVEQLSKLSQAASEGKLGEGLQDAASYTKETNTAFAAGLAKSRNRLLYDLDSLINNDGVDFLDELEDILLQADIGVATSDDVMEEVRSLREDGATFFSQADLKSVLRSKLLEALDTTLDRSIRFSDNNEQPTVLFLMGANGMGKTTTIGKLAYRLTQEGSQKVMVAACDTFRAGAVDQLQSWADRSNSTCYRAAVQGDSSGKITTSPSAVLYGALETAQQERYDTLLVDTSGRLSNNDQLTQELVKMKRVVQTKLSVEKIIDDDNNLNGKPKPNPTVPHETLLVIDAAQGRMALDSARQWHQEVGLTGLILTKLDGSARGGSVVAVSRELGIPVKLVGVGEGLDDLRDFDPESFVDSLLGIGTAGGSKAKDASNEGKELEKRLEVMRKARDDRAKVTESKAAASRPPAMPQAVNSSNNNNNDGVTPITNTNTRVLTKPGGKKKKKKKKGKR